MNKQTGFTLIELMIVVAVIGVLSAIAIPQYQKYVAKAEVASALSTLTALKTNVEAYTVENGKFPASGEEDNLGRPAGMSASTTTTAGITFTQDGIKGKGYIQYEFPTANVNDSLKGLALLLNRDENGTWTCDTSEIEKSLVPKNCTSSK